MSLSAGTRLGPYEITGALGAGGMGEVYRARDTRLERSVAIKVLPDDFAGSADLKARFEREARTISQLNHPNICTLYDIGHEGGVDYLVMELLEGETLADRLTKGPLPLAEVLRYGAQIADALARAHRQSITHRDLKPGNVMLTKSGAKLLDFGLAKTLTSSRPASAPHDATEHRPLTQEGTILGTFQYMAPEQLADEEADARTDLFALGAVLYEMTTGAPAFTGKNRTSLVANILSVNPRPISELQPLTPPSLERLIQRCLAKDPDARWQSAHDVAEELRWIGDAGSQAGVAAPVTARRKTRERLIAVIAILALAVLAATAALLVRSRRPEPVYSFTVPRADGPYSMSDLASISSDGKLLCFIARNGENRQIFVRSLESFEVRALEGTDNPTSGVQWSTEGNSILFQAEGKIKVVNATGGAPRSVAEAGDAAGASMNGEGVILLGSVDGAGIRRISSRDGRIEKATTLDQSRHEAAHMFPLFLPGGKRFLFVTFTRDPSKTDQPLFLYAGSLDSKKTTLIGEIPSAVAYVPSGHLLFVRDGTLMAVRFDVDSLAMKGDPEPVAEGVEYFKPTGGAEFSVSANGVLTYRAPIGGQSLVWVDRTGRKSATLGPVGQFNDFRLAPDGLSVLASVVDVKIGTGDIWSYGTRRETGMRVTSGPGYEASPVFTPDGKRLLYANDRLGVPDIFLKQLGSAEEDRAVVVAPGLQEPCDVSPDGRFLIFNNDEFAGNHSDLFVVPLDWSTKPAPFVKTPFSESDARFSPDGKWVAYQSDQSGQHQIYVKPFPGPGEARQISTKGGTQPRWSPNGRQLYFREARKIFVADVTAPDSEPQLLFENPQRFGSFEVSREGDRFLMSMYDDLALQVPTRVIVNWPGLLRQRAAKR